MTRFYGIIVDDRLVQRRSSAVGVRSRGKRVSKDCPLTREEIRTYVERGVIQAVKLIRDSRDLGLKDAYDLLNRARGGNRAFERFSSR